MLRFKRFAARAQSEIAPELTLVVPEADAAAVGDGTSRARNADEILETLAMVEGDILDAVRSVRGAAVAASESATRSGEAIGDIRRRTGTIATAAGRMAAEVGEIAQASDEFAATSNEIARIVTDASSGAERAAGSAEAMKASFETLSKAAAEIGAILDTISGFARQTNLLALNATIEAARAGAAGRGFAVVASEVKGLSGASEKAAADIRRQIDMLRGLVSGATASAQKLAEEIGGLQPLFAAASTAVQQQNAAAGELAGQVNTAASFAGEMRDTIGEIDDAAANAADQTAAADRSSAKVSHQIGDLGRRFTTVIRQTSFGNRRRTLRLPVEVRVLAHPRHGAAKPCETMTIDLGAAGVLLADAAALPGPGSALRLAIGDLPDVPARVVARSALGVHCAFEDAAPSFQASLQSQLDGLQLAAMPLVTRAQDSARRIGAIFEDAIASGEATEAQIFDTAYQLIPGTDPQQYTVALLPKLEAWLTPLQEAMKAGDPAIVFCCAVDRNGYLPVHNLVFSQPQRADDPVWNAANSRNRRIFDDRAGLTCARSTQPFLIHAYRRDMGGGRIEILKEYVAPITVRGRHWGGFRSSYRI